MYTYIYIYIYIYILKINNKAIKAIEKQLKNKKNI